MKSILITGAKDSGKSTTIQEICENLNPSKIYKLNIDNSQIENNQIERSFLSEGKLDNIFNDTFVIEVQGKLILVLSGCPTEQGIKLTIIFECCIFLKLDIKFSIVAKRLFEKKENYNTEEELKNKSEIIYKETISKIKSIDYKINPMWDLRIKNMVSLIENNLQ